jgi:SRSO17 transposase
MVAASVIEIGIEDELVGVAPEVKDRLAAYFADVASGLVRSEQRRNAELYARGLMEAGSRKSLEPMVARLGGGPVEYEALQHFLADSPWDPGVVDRAVAERVCAVIEPAAWVLDDTGVPKDGKHSPGVKRQYSGTLGKIGNCQIAVSLHAVSVKGTVPLGFRLYLPEDWCQDPVRRREAKIPASVEFQTKPALGGDLVARAAGWKIRRAPVLGDQAYGNDAKLRTRLHADGIDYVLSVGPESDVFDPGTVFAVPERKPGSRGPAPSALQTESQPRSIAQLVAGLDADAFQTVAFRDLDGRQLVSRFAFVRVIAAHPVVRDRQAPREEWLIAEWPEGRDEPTDYWLSNLPADTEPEQLARLARLRWMIELDYKQLKGELGLDHYEGRSYLGFHHHCALVTAAHGFLTLERADPNHPRPA